MALRGSILLLQIALADQDGARLAWNEWSAANNLDDASWPEVRLLAAAARRVRLFDPQSPLLRRLEGVRRFVWTTTQLNINKARPLLAALCDAGIRLMLIKGAARLALDPQSAADRYLNDIDVLLHLQDWPKALDLANRKGWQSPLWPTLTPEIFPHHHAVMIKDDSGSVIDLHHNALFMCRNAGDDDGLWRRAKATNFRGFVCFAPSPADEVLISIAHGLLYADPPVADWILDIAPLIRSGDVDWTVLEAETCDRNIEPNIASGLLLAGEQFGLPVPQAMLDRLIARVREPFITDFRHFSTCHMPSDAWVIERVKAAAALRALSTTGRVNGQPETPPIPLVVRPEGGRTKQIWSTISNAVLTPFAPAPPTASRPANSLLAPLQFSEVTEFGPPVIFPVPPNLGNDALLTLHISLDVEPRSWPFRAVLEVAMPGLMLKRWLAPAAAQRSSCVVHLPAALLTMRRADHIRLRALQSNLAAPFKNVEVVWSILDNPISTCPELLQFFDPVWYGRKQPATACSDTEQFWEYVEAGHLEGRNPGPAFDANKYLDRNPDVADAGFNPLLHYVSSGKAEGRVAYPSDLDLEETPSDALASRPDADQYRLVAESGYFDPEYYRTQYPEVLISDLSRWTSLCEVVGAEGDRPGLASTPSGTCKKILTSFPPA